MAAPCHVLWREDLRHGCPFDSFRATGQGYLAHNKKPPPPKDPPRTLGNVLLQGPRAVRFLISEVPLYGASDGGSGVEGLPH